MLKKTTLLLLVLVLPVAIYLFLKGFGQNQYEVSVYHLMDPEGCGDVARTFIVPANKTNKDSSLGKMDSDGFKVINFLTDSSVNNQFSLYVLNLTRAYDAFFDSRDVYFISLVTPILDSEKAIEKFNRERDKTLSDSEKWLINDSMDLKAYKAFLKCGLGLESDKKDPAHTIVLVDKKNRVRGYYDGLSNEDTERLILEIRILQNDEQD